jgi:hypothetical protein
MSLKEELRGLSPNKRKYMLLRIAGMDTQPAIKLTGITRGTYNSWMQQATFVTIHRRRDELTQDYRHEAIQALRRDNQLSAVLLEGQILAKMKEELETGEYRLIKSHLAREVYSKLMSDLDAIASTQVVSWEQRIQQIFMEGNNGKDENSTPEGSQQEEPIEGELVEETGYREEG